MKKRGMRQTKDEFILFLRSLRSDLQTNSKEWENQSFSVYCYHEKNSRFGCFCSKKRALFMEEAYCCESACRHRAVLVSPKLPAHRADFQRHRPFEEQQSRQRS